MPCELYSAPRDTPPTQVESTEMSTIPISAARDLDTAIVAHPDSSVILLSDIVRHSQFVAIDRILEANIFGPLDSRRPSTREDL